jgi:hypothetical protein
MAHTTTWAHCSPPPRWSCLHTSSEASTYLHAVRLLLDGPAGGDTESIQAHPDAGADERQQQIGCVAFGATVRRGFMSAAPSARD